MRFFQFSTIDSSLLLSVAVIIAWLGVVSISPAQNRRAEVATALEKYRAGDLDGALKTLEPLLADGDLDQAAKLRVNELAAGILHKRGEQHFRQARIAESLADFDREIELQPDQAAEHWQRGIACYYAGQFEKGAQQFKLHQTVNPQDVENAAWHFLCLARTPKWSIDAARKVLIPVSQDSRVPMAQIQEMFAGTITPEEVLKSGEKQAGTGEFYAALYSGLFYEALGDDTQSLHLIQRAAENPAALDNYMGDVARVHVRLRKQPKPASPDPRPADAAPEGPGSAGGPSAVSLPQSP